MEMRAQVEKKMAQKEKEKKEEKLRELAQIARDRRAGIKSHGDKGESVNCLVSQHGQCRFRLRSVQFYICNTKAIEDDEICPPAAVDITSRL